MTHAGRMMLLRVEYHLARDYCAAIASELAPLTGVSLTDQQRHLAAQCGPIALLLAWSTVRNLWKGGR